MTLIKILIEDGIDWYGGLSEYFPWAEIAEMNIGE